MAEANGSKASSNGSNGRSRSSSANRKLRARDAVISVQRELPPLLGRPVEAVLGVEQGDDGWEVSVQVVELERVPRTTDILGVYTVQLDDQGELIGYRRRRRLNRSQVDED